MLPTEPNTDYDSPLEARVLAGDVTGVMDLLDAMGPAERFANRPAMERMVFARWRMLRPDPANLGQALDKHQANRLFRAIDLARFLCSSEHPPADYWMHIGVQDIAAFKQRYQPTPSTQSVEQQLRGEHGWGYRHHVHRAIVAGLIERPQTDAYQQALFFGDLRAESNIVLKHFDADPGLAPYLLQLFEHEGTSDGSFAAVEKYCHDPDLTWTQAFLTLCERGVYTRAQLLDKTLGTLACDWPQFKSGWFSRFHERLAPTVDEMAAFAPRYLALCHSRIAPTVSLAMDAIAPLYAAGLLDDDQVCEAMQPVLGSAVKGRVLSALEVLGQVVKNAPARAASVGAIGVHALAHTGADVQKKTIACLHSWGLDAAGQEVARGYLPFVSAVNQAALQKLLRAATGTDPSPLSSPPSSPSSSPTAPSPIPTPVKLSPLDPSRALQPLVHVVDVVERMAYVLENPVDVDEWERVAEALVRMAPLPATDRAAFLALKKRAKGLDWNTKPLGFALARLMACAVDGEDTASGVMVLQPDQAVNIRNFIAWRTYSLIAQAATGLGLPPLSTPTHRGGFIDPQQLNARIAAYQQAGVHLSESEQAFAQMRLAPLGDARLSEPRILFDWHVSTKAYDGGGDYHTLHVTYHPKPQPTGDHDYAALLCAKHVEGGRWGSGTRETAHIRFAASLQPSDQDPLFAEAARAFGNNLDWWEAQWENRAYLDLLLDPTTAISPMAHLVLGLALAGKEPGQTALAVDILVNSVKDGRIDLASLGNTLARLWATPMVKGPRYGKSLAAAAQAHAALPPAVFALLCAMVVVRPDAPRRDLAPLLELLLELKIAHQLTVPADTCTTLASMRLSGKSKLAAQEILAHC